MERNRGAQAVVISLLTAWQPVHAASCDLGHAPAVPVVKTLPYKDARAAILSHGWAPLPGKPHNGLSDNETSFRERGFTELQFCRLSNDSLCRFAFAAPGGVTLWLTTTGDENPTLGSQAIVRAAKLACRADGDPG